MRLAILAFVLALTGTARAHPILVDDRIVVVDPPVLVVEPTRPPPVPDEPLHTRIGLRTGAGWFQLAGRDVTGVGLVQLTADLELARKLRLFGEYEFLILSERPRDPAMDSVDGIGHRVNAGLSREVLGTSKRNARFSATAELGGGATLLSGAIGAHTVPHGFAGLRLGFELRPESDAKRPPSFGFELVFRGMVVGDGPGFLFGLGLQWGA